MADEKGDGGKGRKRENGRCDDGRRGDFRLHGAGAPCTDCNGPYGMAVSVPQGTEAVMTGGVCLGVVNDAGTLLPGEVRLFSTGGAEIVLKLDGTVVINGQVFEKKEE